MLYSESENMQILDYFPSTPKISTPRPQQIEVLEWYAQKRLAGAKKFIICVPTGGGKSGIAKTIANFEAAQGRKTLITSPLNTLVEQYKEFEKDKKFPAISLVGKKHYTCMAMRELKGERVTCENGFCTANICTMDYARKLQAKTKLKLFESRDCDNCDEKTHCICNECVYKQKFREFSNAMVGNSNFTLLQMRVTNAPAVVIVDECDYMEPFVRMFHKVTIDEYWHFNSFCDYAMCLEDKVNCYQNELSELENSFDTAKTRKILTDKIERIQRLLKDINATDETYIVSEDNQITTPFEPVTIDRFLSSALGIDERVVILMSATPKKIEGFEFIEVKSPFPKEIRPFKCVPTGSMTLKNREATIPKLAQMLVFRENLIPGKTIVHVSSYDIARKLGLEVTKVSKGKSTPIVQSTENTVAGLEGATLRGDVIEKFKKSKDTAQILIAVNMGRGIDLPEKDITNNIITFVKRQNPTEHLTRAKYAFMGKEWEYEEAANELMQQYGRVNRNDQKITNTIITEPEWASFFRKHRQYFRDWFIEAVI